MTLSRRTLLGAAGAAPFVHTGHAAARRPNVVMFLTDDHGAWATGAYGCPSIHTPNIDHLATTGARFTNAFACTPVCSPSRMTYMTGALPSHHHVQDWLIPEDSYGPRSHRWLDGFRTYTEVLAGSGYTLGMCGKWHMGDDDKAQAGFTYWASVPGGGGTYRDPVFVHNGTGRKIEGFKTDIQTDFALDFLDRHHRQPFYLYVPFYAPHTPFDLQPERDRQWYRGDAFPCFPDTPKHPWQNKGLARMHGSAEAQARLLRPDQRSGLQHRPRAEASGETGGSRQYPGGICRGPGVERRPSRRMGQRQRYRAVQHVRGIVARAAHLEPPTARSGRAQSIDAMVSSYDYYHSILDYIGIRPPGDRRHVGASYAPFLAGKRPAWRDRLYFEYAYVRAVRTGNLKYVERTDGYPSELFDIEADPGETRNAFADPAYARQLEGLRADLAGWFRQAGAPPLADWRKTTTQVLEWDRKPRE